MRRIKAVLLLAVLLSVNVLMAQANKGASISGYVKDSRTKSPLIEAVVTISSNAFEGVRFGLTDSSGLYTIKDLPAGNYTITFEMEGFKRFTQENIVVKEGMSIGVSFQMAREDKKKKAKAAEQLDVTNQ